MNQQFCTEIISEVVADPTSGLLRFRRPDIFNQINKIKTNLSDERLNSLTYASSRIKIWWNCNNNLCGCHIWEGTIYSRTRIRINNKMSGCPYCSGRKMCEHSISIMNNELLAKEFDPNLNPEINPYLISPFSHKNLTWRCINHKSCDEHIWISKPHDRSNGTKCPFCSFNGTRQVCKCNSIMANPLLKLLHEEFDFININNKDINPYKISAGSHVHAWWKCFTCNFIWRATFLSRTYGTGCPTCASIRKESKGELRCKSYLKRTGIEFYQQIKLNYIPSRRYDFGFIWNNITFLVEIDGAQHMKFVPLWHKTNDQFIIQQQIDKIKSFIPLILGISILRISNDNAIYIEQCVNTFSYIKSMPEYNNVPLLVLDDINNYNYLFDYFNVDLIKRFTDSSYINEIIEKFNNLKFFIFDLKTNRSRPAMFNLDQVDSI